MRDKRVAILLVALMLAAGFTMVWTQDAGGDGVEAGWTDVSSDITVNAGTIYSIENESYIMNASIYVYGTLYINYTYIEFGGDSDGDYGIFVYDGGSLYMKYSNISAYDKNTWSERGGHEGGGFWGVTWLFQVSGNLWISHCDLSYMWGNDDQPYVSHVNGGLQIYSTVDKTVIVEDTMIYNTQRTGIYIGSGPVTIGSSSHSSKPKIHRVTISNITAVGLIAIGGSIYPDVQNCTIIGNGYKGGNYYYGASGVMKNTTFENNKDFGFSFDPITGGTMYIYDCKFTRNAGSGYAARRGGTVYIIDCEFNENGIHGIDMKWENPVGPEDSNPQLIIIRGGAKNNVLDGFGSSWDDCTATIQDVDVAYNGRHGIKTNSSKMSVTLFGAKVHHNAGWGIYIDGSKGELYDSFVYENGLGGVFLDRQTTSTTRGCKINDTEIGIQSQRSTAAITGNTITGTNKAISLLDSMPDLIQGNVIVGNFIGIESSTDGTNLKANTISGSGSAGIRLFEAKDCMIEGGNFENNNIGISLDDGSTVAIDGVTIIGSTNTGSIIEGGSSFVIENSTFTGNNRDLTLNDASSGIAVNTSIPLSKMSILDQLSTFKNYQLMDIYAVDNMTGDFISMPTIIVYDRDLNEILNAQMSVDGWARKMRLLEYSFEGPLSDDNNPVNITLSKDGYIPYWGGSETVTSYLFRQVEMPINYAPVWLTPLMVSPAVTHTRRPTITWNASWDWNSDVIKHKLNVYQDEISPSNIILEDAIVRQYYVNDDPQQGSIPPTYTFDRNLRFNHQFYVTVTTFDPWGMSSSGVFTFMTVNNKPTAPEISISPTPASTRDDIVVEIVTPSTDIDVDPIDEISYFVSFEIERLGSWELIQSGTEMVLPYSMTMENSRIRAIVKPFDGYEFGPEVMAYTNVINFLPKALVDYVHVELTEDEAGHNLVDLSSLFMDEDGDVLSYNVVRENYVTMEIDPLSGDNVLIPDQNFFGQDYIIVEAMDNKVHAVLNWPTVQINVTVLPVNDPPSLLRVNDIAVREGKPVILEGVQGSMMVIVPTAYDPDMGDEQTFSHNMVEALEGKIEESAITFDANSGRLDFMLTNSLVGINYFNLTVSDREGATSSVTIQLVVANINDPVTAPTITSPENGADIKLKRGEKVTFTADPADDPDLHIPNSNEFITYKWEFGDGSVRETDLLTLEHDYGSSNTYVVTLTATDSMGLSKSHSISINVEIEEEIVVPGPTIWEEPLKMLPYILLVLVVILGIIGILIFVFKREPLEDVAEAEEKAHEALIAEQQTETQRAQELLHQGYLECQSTLGQAEQHEALPAAPGEHEQPMPPEPSEEGPVPAPEPVSEPVPEAQPPEEPFGSVPQPENAEAPPTYLPPNE